MNNAAALRTCCRVYAAVDDTTLPTLISRLRAHCLTFGADVDLLEEVFSVPGSTPPNVLRVTRDLTNADSSSNWCATARAA